MASASAKRRSAACRLRSVRTKSSSGIRKLGERRVVTTVTLGTPAKVTIDMRKK
jgi:hypothetical protein